MDSTQREYNTKVFDSYIKFVTGIAYSLGECSPEVCAEIKQTWIALESQTL